MEHEIISFLRSLEAWHWGVFGMLLLVAEMLMPAFVLLWFGVSALIISAVLFIAPEISWQIQTMLWGGISVISAITWRVYRIYEPISHQKEYQSLNRRGDAYVGKTFVLDTPLVAKRGVLSIGDGSWLIESHEENIPAGTKVIVTQAVGTLLHVEPHKES